jgi:hypothetical protein
MRICKVKGKEKKVSLREWNTLGRPKPVGCSNRINKVPKFQGINHDWSDIDKTQKLLSYNYAVLEKVSKYIYRHTKLGIYDIARYVHYFRLIEKIIDFSFDAGWTGELSELDAKNKKGLSLSKLKFISKDKKNGRKQTKGSDQGIELQQREEEGSPDQDIDKHERSSGSIGIVGKPKAKAKASPKKGSGSSKKGS